MDNKVKLSDYQNAVLLTNNIPRFYLGQEVTTKDGKGIIVELKMDWNGLYIQPNTSEAVVWYSTESAVHRTEGGRWITFTYYLTDIKP